MDDNTNNAGMRHFVTWDQVMEVVQRACPSLGLYGQNTGGDVEKMMRIMNSPAKLDEIAAGIIAADARYRVATSAALQTLAAARKQREAAIAAIVSECQTK